MQALEALYVVEFGDVAASGFRNGGVAVLETSRVFGGDSGYFYLGNYEVDRGVMNAKLKVVKHNPAWANAFGDAANEFEVRLSGAINNGVINGHMERVDRPGIKLPIRLTRKAPLPG